MSASSTYTPPPQSDAILKRLLTLHPKKIDLVLDRIQNLLAKLGHPERSLPPIIHVAGTNGKGSTLAFMRSILEAAGYSVHSYTSPHLVHFHERIHLAQDGGSSAPICEKELSAALDACEQANNGAPITFFEITTAAALLVFSQHPAHIVLIEVGLGGRYDATNVVQPALSVITPVGYDHAEFLGSDLGNIAHEKAGILKPGTPGIIGPQDPAALRAIENAANACAAPLIIAGQDYTVFEEGGRLIFQDLSGLLDLPLPKLRGRHQHDNAGLAIAAVRALEDMPVNTEAFEQGLLSADWPGRCELLPAKLAPAVPDRGEPPELWLDGGHNAHAATALAHAMAELEDQTPRPLYLILGMLNTKNAADFLRPFETLARHVFAIPIERQDNTMPPEDLCMAAKEAGIEASPATGLEDALMRILGREAPAASQAPRILICGSLYLAGQVLKKLEEQGA